MAYQFMRYYMLTGELQEIKLNLDLRVSNLFANLKQPSIKVNRNIMVNTLETEVNIRITKNK